MGLDNAASGYKIEFNEKNTKLIEIVRNLSGNTLLPVISNCKHSKNFIAHISQDGFKPRVNTGIELTMAQRDL